MANLSKPIIAAFDFDGTLTYHDSLLPFLRFVAGTPLTLWNLFLETPRFVGYLLGLSSRQEIKEALMTRFLKGMPQNAIEKLAKNYASTILPTMLRPGALERIQWHKNQGHRCLLISANLDLYLLPWGQSMGFDEVIASRVAYSSDHLITGRLDGLNCRGQEKVRRLIEKEGPKENYLLYAYGDSSGDFELLELADVSFYRKLNE